MLLINNFQFPVYEPYKKVALEIYFQGCSRNTCTGECHNPELRSFKGGKLWSLKELMSYLMERSSLVEVVSFTGGDPLLRDLTALYGLVIRLKWLKMFQHCELWLFTGENDWEAIPAWCKLYFDVIKYGGYMKEYVQEGFPASSNQKIFRKGEQY